MVHLMQGETKPYHCLCSCDMPISKRRVSGGDPAMWGTPPYPYFILSHIVGINHACFGLNKSTPNLKNTHFSKL